MKNPRRDARFEQHKAMFLQYICPSQMRGLEIGALDLPFVTPDEGDVEFADYAATEELRERARVVPGYSAEFVVPVDYVLRNVGWDGVPDGYDWIAAAHVIEHAPSMIDWLRSAGDKLNEGGLLFLVVPDKRYTFDFFRPESTLGKIFEDHLINKTRPGISEVFDASYYSRSMNPVDIWKNSDGIQFDVQHTEHALAIVKSAGAQYIDVHCNIFTDRSFSLIMGVLCRENWVPFTVENIGTVEQFGIDFHCVLRKTPRS
jgi:hypothetical protein